MPYYKMFIVTLQSGDEGFEFAPSLAALAISLENTHMSIRAIEEVPEEAQEDALKSHQPFRSVLNSLPQ